MTNTNGTWQFHVGMQVVCIDDSTMPEQYLEVKPGEIYTLSSVGIHESYIAGEYLGVRLVGIDRGICPQFGDLDPPLRTTRFRPVVPHRLASLRSLLAGNPLSPSIDEPKHEKVEEEEKV
jgi:hypothetical protein